MIDKGKLIIIGATLSFCIIYVVLALVFNDKDLGEIVKPTYLVVDNKIVWKKEEDNWKTAIDTSEIENIKFNIYGSEQSKGYISVTNNATYVKEKYKNEYRKKGIRAAISKGTIKLADYELEDIYVKSDYYALSTLNDVPNYKLDSFDGQIVDFDFDNDQTIETLYLVSNISLNSASSALTKVFLVDNDEIIEIENSGMYRFDLLEILDLDNDDKYEIILEKKKKTADGFDTCYQLYELKNGKYKATKTCEL